MKPKKILLLGGSFFQIPSIEAVKRMGHYAITCDYRPDNPGHRLADEYHNISTTDREGVLKLAQKLKIDAVVCYLSDPSAPTAAYVAEKLGLPGQPLEAVEILTHKDRFRAFLATHGFKTPRAFGATSLDEARERLQELAFPVMVKPTDSCGSKGVTKLSDPADLPSAVATALEYSIEKRFIVEEFVEKDGYQIDGDGFSVDGKLVFRCFGNQHNDPAAGNPYVPSAISFPYDSTDVLQQNVHDELQRALLLLGMRNGAYNFEVRVGKDQSVNILEIGPRNGGNLIPQVTRYATGVDMVEDTIRAALGEDCSSLHMVPVRGFWASYLLHSNTGGIYESVEISDDLRRNNVVEFSMEARPGDRIQPFTGAYGTIGAMILRFSSMDEMLDKMDHMHRWVKVRTNNPCRQDIQTFETILNPSISTERHHK